MCDGSNFSNGNRKPVALVGQAGHPVGGEKAEHGDNAGNDRDQTDDYVYGGKSRQAHTQDHDTLPFLIRPDATTTD